MPDHPSALTPDLLYPKIRPVEAIPMNEESQPGICLRDTRQIARNILILPPAAFLLVSLFDGHHSLSDIQKIFQLQTGQRIPLPQIEGIVLQLDQELFLESNTFQEELTKIYREYSESPYREAAFAGLSYPSEPAELRGKLNGFLREIQDESPLDTLPPNKDLALLIAPHIDLNRGGHCFAHAYREFSRHSPADLYVILGTGHQCVESLFALTRKSYNTPLGELRTDEEFVERFGQQAPANFFQEELLHRNEHSVEFQTLWLRHLLPSDWNGAIVPILCGSFHPYIEAGKSPREDDNLRHSLDELREMIHGYPGRVMVVAGVDFSHVGKRFGHAHGIPPNELERVRKEDETVLDALRSGSAEAFFSAVEKEKDHNNLCGLSSIYIALDLIRPSAGYVLHYDRAMEPETESVVTFASLAFYR